MSKKVKANNRYTLVSNQPGETPPRRRRKSKKEAKAPMLLPKNVNDRKKMMLAAGELAGLDPQGFPYRCICFLVIRDKDDQLYFGTGFMISERCVVTAGHCVFFHDDWARAITVIPANGIDAPFGKDVSTVFHSNGGWTNGQQENCDYGAIILPSNKLHERVGETMACSDVGAGHLVELSGYPGDMQGEQVNNAGEIKRVFPYRFSYAFETSRGQSGSPVFIHSGGNISAIGVHSFGGGGADNYAVRITRQVADHFNNWITK